jgi:hypothetical protein
MQGGAPPGVQECILPAASASYSGQGDFTNSSAIQQTLTKFFC